MTQITNKPSPSRPPIPQPLLPLLRPEYRARVGTGLLAGAASFAVLVLVLLIRFGLTNLPVTIWAGALVLVLSATGSWAHLGEPRTPEDAANEMRLLALTVGGAVGFATAVLGLALPIFSYSSVFSGGLEVWRQNWWRVMLCALALFGGLVLMFLSLQLGRAAERTSPGIRRLLYGYNTALTGMLLLAILAVVNVLADVRIGALGFFSKPWDWTASGIYSLSPATEDFLKHLDKPVKVYVIMRGNSLGAKEMDTLLENFRGITDKVTATSVSRDLNQEEFQALAEKYQLPGSLGLLVVYGTEPGEQSEFIPLDQLFANPSIQTSTEKETKRSFLFKGEGVLLKTLKFLAEGKKKPVIYFTQGNGEPDLASVGGDQFTASLAELRDQLMRRNYEVKELKLTAGVDQVPTDAEVVVVVNPRTGLPANAVKALDSYMNPTGARPKGKMMVLADVMVKGDRSGMAPMGLEGLLNRFNVRLGNERILVARKRFPTRVQVMPNLRSKNPIARGFVGRDGIKLFVFEDARPVETLPSNPRLRSPYKTEVILQTFPEQDVWKENNLSAPTTLVAELLTPDRIDELRQKVRATGGPVSVAVVVSESTSTLPDIPQHRNLADGEDKPRLVVFGDSTWITDEGLGGPGSRFHVDLFASSLAWLRQRQGIGVDVKEGKDRKEFTLAGSATPDMVSRLRWTPVALMLLAIVGLGGTIWLVRRR